MSRPQPPARITNPRLIPVAGHDAHLPALPEEALQPDAIRRRLTEAADHPPEIPGDGRVLSGRTAAAAAVLIPLVLRPDGLQVLLTQRSAHLRDHAGQISFPGGRTEPTDTDPADTALREAEEEIGLPRRCVEVVGTLPTYTTVTGFVVSPVVGLVSPPFELRPDPTEVEEAFEVPLRFLMTPAHHRRHVFHFDGGQRQFLSMPWTGDGREFYIWGATAAMLRNFYRLLAR
jgi:8-oxo-dGTP pyrophosphatase MutT (NUDIX family)